MGKAVLTLIYMSESEDCPLQITIFEGSELQILLIIKVVVVISAWA